MSCSRITGLLATLVAAGVLATSRLAAQATAVNVDIFKEMAWRSLGPYRAGRATAAGGSAEPGIFFEGVEGAGLWKTTDDGLSWTLALETPPRTRVSAVATARSRTDVVYAALDTIDGPSAISVSQSDDGGDKWAAGTDLGTTGAVAALAIDPRDPVRVWVAVDARNDTGTTAGGLFRSVDAGRTFTRVALGDPSTSALDVTFDPTNPATLYAVIQRRGADATIVRSTNGGGEWRPLTGVLPDSSPDSPRALAIAPSDSNRLYATADIAGDLRLFRSDNGGDSWAPTGGVLSKPGNTVVRRLSVDPQNPDRLLLVAGGVWFSSDAGRHMSRWEAAVFGSDARILARDVPSGATAIGGDSGLRISVNGGRTWSSPFAQPTTDLATVHADTAFPFRVCGTQTSGGSLCVPSRIEADRVGLPAWQLLPIPGRVRSDPNDADAIYSGTGVRWDRRTGQTQDIGPADFSGDGDSPVAFSADGRTVYLADRMLRRSLDSGRTWTTFGPEASAPITSVAVSPIDARTVWSGTADGIVRVTRDGGITWTSGRVTPVGPVATIEPSHFDTQSAYVTLAGSTPGAVLLRTRDAGATWISIVNGLTDVEHVFVAREDPFRRGLLFAGTDRSVFASFDDGATWQAWRLNLPFTAVRDLAIHDATIVAATGGRGFWALEDISPLRQLTPDILRADAFLFRVAPASRMRVLPDDSVSGDAAQPPAAPDGATIAYLLGPDVHGPVALDIIETATAETIRHVDLAAIGKAGPGLHLVAWDLRDAPPTSDPRDRGPLVLPGTYQVRLTSSGRPIRQAIVIRMDPRVHVVVADLAAELSLARRVASQLTESDRARQTATGDRRLVLERAIASLRDVMARLGGVDGRPSPALESAAAAAVATAVAAGTSSH